MEDSACKLFKRTDTEQFLSLYGQRKGAGSVEPMEAEARFELATFG